MSHRTGEQPGLDALIEQMAERLGWLRARADPRRDFHATYLRTTRAVRAELDAGRFVDATWVASWTEVFAGRYLTALDRAGQGRRAPGPWAVAWAADGAAMSPRGRVLLGMNAHINYDLPLALLDVVDDAGFEDERLLAEREADHRHIDDVLLTRVRAEQRATRGTGPRHPTDRLLEPILALAAGARLRDARAKVWANALSLARARRDRPDAYRARRDELERLATFNARVLMHRAKHPLALAVRGFGIVLTDADRRARTTSPPLPADAAAVVTSAAARARIGLTGARHR